MHTLESFFRFTAGKHFGDCGFSWQLITDLLFFSLTPQQISQGEKTTLCRALATHTWGPGIVLQARLKCVQLKQGLPKAQLCNCMFNPNSHNNSQQSDQLELFQSQTVTPWSLGASVPTRHCLPAPGVGFAKQSQHGPVQLPMQRHRAPLRVLCGHWAICRGLVAVTGGLGQVPAHTEQMDTR